MAYRSIGGEGGGGVIPPDVDIVKGCGGWVSRLISYG